MVGVADFIFPHVTDIQQERYLDTKFAIISCSTKWLYHAVERGPRPEIRKCNG